MPTRYKPFPDEDSAREFNRELCRRVYSAAPPGRFTTELHPVLLDDDTGKAMLCIADGVTRHGLRKTYLPQANENDPPVIDEDEEADVVEEDALDDDLGGVVLERNLEDRLRNAPRRRVVRILEKAKPKRLARIKAILEENRDLKRDLRQRLTKNQWKRVRAALGLSNGEGGGD